MTYTFLAVSGSLRAGSVNTEVLRALTALAPDHVRVAYFTTLGELPHFNPDLDTETPPPSVATWRAQLRAAQGVVICSPEYAHGVPGVLKNALDWVVGTGEFMYKPVVLINASPASTFITPQLTETLTVMMANVVHAVTLPLAGRKRDEMSLRGDSDVARTLMGALAILVHTANEIPTD